MDARLILISSTLFIFGEGSTTGADPDSNVRIYLELTGEVQGSIVGEVPLPPPSEKFAIEVLEVHDRVFTPVDVGTGLPTGQRRYEGVVIRKPMDKTTPLIASSLANIENMTSAKLLIYTGTKVGPLTHRYTYELNNAFVSVIERDMYGRSSTSTDFVFRPEEEITLRFQSITITDVVNFTQFDDSIGFTDVPEAIEESVELSLTAPESTTTASEEDSVEVSAAP